MNHLSLFTGLGIGDLAAQSAGITTVAQCESDPVCQHVLRTLWPDAHLFEDVRHVTVEALGRLGLLPVDIVSGGFPCQDISTAGKGAGIRGKQSGLWFEMLRVITEVRPRFLLVENVPALRSRGADTVLAGMEAEGYTCWACVVGAWAVGAPHKRDRVWIVGRLDVASGGGQPGNHDIGNGLGVGSQQQQAEHSPTDRLADPLGPAIREAAAGGPDGTQGTAAAGAGEAVADTELCRCVGSANDFGEHFATGRPRGIGADGNGKFDEGLFPFRWPARPGEPQPDWEAPRLTQRGVGCPTDGLSTRVHSRANKSMLRLLGNAWVYPLALLIFRWIQLDNR